MKWCSFWSFKDDILILNSPTLGFGLDASSRKIKNLIYSLSCVWMSLRMYWSFNSNLKLSFYTGLELFYTVTVRNISLSAIRIFIYESICLPEKFSTNLFRFSTLPMWNVIFSLIMFEFLILISYLVLSSCKL